MAGEEVEAVVGAIQTNPLCAGFARQSQNKPKDTGLKDVLTIKQPKPKETFWRIVVGAQNVGIMPILTTNNVCHLKNAVTWLQNLKTDAKGGIDTTYVIQQTHN